MMCLTTQNFEKGSIKSQSMLILSFPPIRNRAGPFWLTHRTLLKADCVHLLLVSVHMAVSSTPDTVWDSPHRETAPTLLLTHGAFKGIGCIIKHSP